VIRWAGLVAILAAGACLWTAFGTPEPSVPAFESVRLAHRPSDAQLLDRNGELLHELRIGETARRLAWVSLSEVSPALQAAVLVSEDRRFYRHGGVDGKALVAALLQRITGGPSRGASTITMQVAALTTPGLRRRSGPRSLTQKWRQMLAAWAMERRWSKAEILEAYLNRVTFRGELQGISTAASMLFGKAPHGVTEAEAAVLASLLRSPNAGQVVVTRRALALVKAEGMTVGRGEIEAAVTRSLDAPSGTGPRVSLAPHAARRLLRAAPGSGPTRAPVRSTLDGSLQRMAADSLRRHLLATRERHVQDGALLVVNNQSGDVLAYVGGSGDLSSAPYVDGIRARRQAGSTLKPFLYALAMERRLLTPASLLEDAPLDLAVAGGLFRPKNYDEQFRGLITVRTALAGSVNIPAVRTLDLVGLEAFVERLRRLGFEGLTESGDYYGPALALGSADVSLWELVNAYRSLANDGVWTPPRMTLGEPPVTARRRLYTAGTAFLISNILADRESRSQTFGLENALATPFWTAVKTGTSKEMRDNWCIGYSRRYTVGVWVGNFSGEPMRDVSGVTGAAPVWAEVMAWLHRNDPSVPPRPPAGLLARRVAFPREVEPARVEWFLAGTEPQADAQILALDHPRILAPSQGSLIALDPDIPPSRQRIVFEARVLGGTTRWILDGADLGAGQPLLAWKPVPGRHTLALTDPDGTPLDAVTFEVRGDRPSRVPDRFGIPE
jgi:penicillin-binding protein 1C